MMLKTATRFRDFATDRSMIPQTTKRICKYNIDNVNEYYTEDATEENNEHIES